MQINFSERRTTHTMQSRRAAISSVEAGACSWDTPEGAGSRAPGCDMHTPSSVAEVLHVGHTAAQKHIGWQARHSPWDAPSCPLFVAEALRVEHTTLQEDSSV